MLVPPAECPTCHKVNDAVTHLNGEDQLPSPGDASMCGYCGTILIFNHDLSVRVASDDDLAEMPDEIKMKFVAAKIAVAVGNGSAKVMTLDDLMPVIIAILLYLRRNREKFIPITEIMDFLGCCAVTADEAAVSLQFLLDEACVEKVEKTIRLTVLGEAKIEKLVKDEVNVDATHQG